MINFAQIPAILLRAFDKLDEELGRPWDPVVAAPGHDRHWCRKRLQKAHTLGELLDELQLAAITEWVANAHRQLEARFIYEEGDDEDGRHEAHWRAVEWLTTLLSLAWWDTTQSSTLILCLSLGELTHGESFPLAQWPVQLRTWLYAAYDAHQLYVQQGFMMCEQPGDAHYQPPVEERLDWD